jgi:hypothetical protein
MVRYGIEDKYPYPPVTFKYFFSFLDLDLDFDFVLKAGSKNYFGQIENSIMIIFEHYVPVLNKNKSYFLKII